MKCEALQQLISIPFPCIAVTKNYQIIASNELALKLLTITAELTENNALFDLFSPFDTNISIEGFIDNPQAPSHIYLSYKNKNTFNSIYKASISPLNNNYRLILLSLEENWQYKYQQESIYLSRLINSIESSNVGIWELDIAQQSAVFSAKFKELLQIESHDIYSWDMFKKAIFQDDLVLFEIFLKSHIQSKSPLNFEFRMEINKQTYWFNIKGETFYQNGEPKTIIGTLTDCTLNKEILNNLNDAIESKNITMKAGKIGTWCIRLINNEWHCEWDHFANEMFGLKTEDIGVLDKWVSIIHPEDREKMGNITRYSFSTGEDLSFKYRIILKDKSIKYFQSIGRAVSNDLGEVYRLDGICIDETEIQEAEKKLKKLNAQLEERVSERTAELIKAKEHAENASQIKSDFLSMMSHELRTPMNGVIGSLDLLTGTKQTPESKDLIDTAKTSAENLVFILNDILDINKIEAGKLELEERVFSISEVIDNVIKVFIPVAIKRDISLHVFEDPDTPMFITGDPMRVRQILFNLIGNALKFTSSSFKKLGEVSLVTTIKQKKNTSGIISLKIIDNGIGIDKKNQEKLFKPFIQAERSTTRQYGGTGLGLAICGKLTEMMGGKITLISEKGKGSSFDAELPFLKSQETIAMDIESLSNIKISIIDCNEKLTNKAKVFSHYLTYEGAHVNSYTLSEYVKSKDNFDILLILLNNNETNIQTILHLLKEIKDKSRITIAVNRKSIDTARKAFKNIRVSCSEPMTRIQLVQCMQHTWQSGFELNLDELDLSSLELDEDENNDVLGLDELDFDFDITEENNHKKSTQASILVVEDNPLNQKLIVKQLDRLGYKCELADDGLQGKIKWEEGNYQLILTDCHMPNIDGYEMTKQIRTLEKSQQKQATPIIAVTGAAMSGDAEYCIASGMNDFLSKPIQLSDLRAMLKKWYK
ncbi:PAS domain-containing hybrid sensor histidine kinase/response regulator [Pseudocolwellia agarivorans]|uniref:PAS domain-containing hybrid sensor histidine kinase/response regulator n=1 Tax=Pseudocolwellia agarivorans TaxID=1911682 RepID=UPI000987CA69|nr:PAS domain-containing hybrid sensor histidine kinase/response regulator [Pseudocolwellia agarivorans]